MVVDPKELVIIGETNFRNMRKKFGIKRDDRRRHVYVIGKSGSGKSVLLENMIMQDINNGNGCCVMDPHGDLAEAIIKCIPPERQKDVIYFNPSDVENPVAFNILEGTGDDSSKNLVASGLIGIFKKIWADSWGPRLEYVLRNTILSLMYAEGSTLLGINRMLTDKKYRNSVLENVHDPIIKAFWSQEFENYPAKELPMIISPIQNKVGQFLSNPIVRNILGQAHSTIDLRDIMDKKKIFLVNLSKGRIGEDNSSLIGSMIVTKLYLAAMSRVNISEQDRSDFYLYVDEFQNFATDSFADILSEARKYRLALIIAHQYVLQLPEKVSDAIFGNGGTLVTFRLGPQDAEIFEKEFGPDFVLEDLVNIPKYNVVLKLLIDGAASKPFSAATLPPITKILGYEDRSAFIIAESRKKYSRTREFVEDQIREWSMSEDEKHVVERKKKEEEFKNERLEKGLPEEKVGEKMYSTNCWVCGMKIEVPFAPDDKRPIYCIDDLKKTREKIIQEPTFNRFAKKVEISANEKAKINEATFSKAPVKREDNRDNRDQKPRQDFKRDDNRNQERRPEQKKQEIRKPEIKKEEIKKEEIKNIVQESIKPVVNNIIPEIKPEIIVEKIEKIIPIPEIKPIIEEKLIESVKIEQKIIAPVQEVLKIEEKVGEIKKEEPDFKSMLSDIMKETGIEMKIVEKEKIEPIVIKSVVEEIKKEEIIEEEIIEEEIEKTIEPVQEVKTIHMSLSQLKEKSFDEIKEELSQNNNKNNQSNILKAGEVIKL